MKHKKLTFKVVFFLFFTCAFSFGTFSAIVYSEKNEIPIELPTTNDPDFWLYERELTISPVTAENDFQIKLQLNPAIFDYAHTNPDGSDLRFYDVGDNPLKFWVENWNITGISTIYVKIPIASTSSIIMRYGNPLAIPASDGDATFVFFDDFENDTLDTDKWYTTGVSGYDLIDGELVISYDDDNGGNLLTTKNPLNQNSFIVEYYVSCYNDFRINLYCSQSPIKRVSGGGDWYMMLVPWAGGDSRIDWFTNGLLRTPKVYTGGPNYAQYKGTLKVKYNSVNNQQVWLNTSSGVMFNNILLSKFSVSNTYLSLSKDGYSSDTGLTNLSYIAVRKYVDFEPSITISSETEIKDMLAPIIAINQPQNADQLTYSPVYDISINEVNLDEIWYTIDDGITNYTITEFVGTINSTTWAAAPTGPVTIRFYARDLAGNVGTSFVIVVKTSEQQPPPAIPGYDLYLLIGVISFTSIIIIRKRFKS